MWYSFIVISLYPYSLLKMYDLIRSIFTSNVFFHANASQPISVQDLQLLGLNVLKDWQVMVNMQGKRMYNFGWLLSKIGYTLGFTDSYNKVEK